VEIGKSGEKENTSHLKTNRKTQKRNKTREKKNQDG
jgi:hypothetical protein